jgi:hypothetical protein
MNEIGCFIIGLTCLQLLFENAKELLGETLWITTEELLLGKYPFMVLKESTYGTFDTERLISSCELLLLPE